MKKIILSAPAIALILGMQFFSSPAFAITEVAKVNDKSITLDQLNARYAEVVRGNPTNPPSKKTILDEMIKREAGVQEAKRMKLDQDPQIQERMNNVLFYALLEKKIGPEFDRFTLSDAEARNWYDKEPEIRTSHIFIALNPAAAPDEEAKVMNRLKELQAEVKSGKMSFAEAAQKNSEDPSAAMGGDLDYRMKDRLDPVYYRAAVKIGKIGEVSGPVRTPFGVHLIRLTGKHSWSEVDHNHVKRIILEDKRQELTTRFMNDLRQKAKVSIIDATLK